MVSCPASLDEFTIDDYMAPCARTTGRGTRFRGKASQRWLVRCSILSGLAEQPEINLAWLLELAEIAIVDGDGTVRVSGAEILGRIVRESQDRPIGEQARVLLQPLQQDQDHRVVAAALNGLQGG